MLAAPDVPAAIRASCLASLRRTQSVIGERGAFDSGLILLGAAERLTPGAMAQSR